MNYGQLFPKMIYVVGKSSYLGNVVYSYKIPNFILNSYVICIALSPIKYHQTSSSIYCFYPYFSS